MSFAKDLVLLNHKTSKHVKGLLLSNDFFHFILDW